MFTSGLVGLGWVAADWEEEEVVAAVAGWEVVGLVDWGLGWVGLG